MNNDQVDQENPLQQRIAEEEKIREKVDDDGTRWTKVYFGGGAHFRNWLSQFVESKVMMPVVIAGRNMNTACRFYQIKVEEGDKWHTKLLMTV